MPDVERGLRFDLSVFPGLYRRRQTVPAVTADTGFYPWSADANLQTYTFRHVLGELESFFADISYSAHEGGQLIRTQLVNRTALRQQVSLHFLASINFPESGPGRRPPLRASEVTLPPGAVWIDGPRYAELILDEDSPVRHLTDNAEIWGETRGDGVVHGIALGHGFGARAGQCVTYALPAGFAPADTAALMRFRLARGASASLRATGACAASLTLEGTGNFQLVELPLLDAGARSFHLESLGRAALEIDG